MSMSKVKNFLNKVNKQEFLRHLREYMNCYGIKSVQSYADDDILIATTAVERSRSRNVVVVGKDTDLLILLIHHYTNRSENSLHLTSSGERNFSLKKIYHIAYMKNSLPSVIVECILPIYAFLRCGTVSRVCSIGKGKESLKKILENEKMQACLRELTKRTLKRPQLQEMVKN